MNIEPLEARIAPASFTFTDVDGDNVVITTTGPGALVPGGNVIFIAGKLTLLDLTAAAFQAANVSIVATRDPVAGGDGLVNVGRIDATGRDLGTVLVDGDLAVLDAGDAATPASACKGLTVQSLGRLGTSLGVPDLVSDFAGRLDKLTVKGDVKDAIVDAGSIGSVFIGGSLIGGAADGSGLIQSREDMGRVKVGGDLVGGAGNASGTIYSGNALAGVSVGGSLIGGTHPGGGAFVDASGAIYAEGTLGPVKIGHDLRGGSGGYSGAIFSETQIVSVTIGGSVAGGSKQQSGSITTTGLCGPVTIKGDLAGSFASSSGVITATQDITSVTIGGSLLGGSGIESGVISSVMGRLGPVKIGGDIEGGRGAFSGRLFGKTQIVSASVGGSLLGGYPIFIDPDDSGRIHSDGAIGPVKIGRDIVGGEGARSGSIEAATTLGPVTVGGSLRGGGNTNAGTILSGGAMGLVKIGKDIIAGSQAVTAMVHAGGTLAGITLGGSLDGNVFRHGHTVGTQISSNTARITSDGAMGPVKIAGDVLGNLLNRPRIASMNTLASLTIGGSVFGGEIFSAGALGPVKIGGDLRGVDSGSMISGTFSGSIEAQRIASLFIGGSIYAGVDADSNSTPEKNGSVRAVDDIGPIVIKGSLVGSIDTDGDPSDGDVKPVVISARGQAGISFSAKNDVAIKSITIGGRVELAQILAGYDVNLGSRNADAQIGPITIGGDLIASSIAAGVETAGPFFGGTDFKMAGPGVKDSLDTNGAISKIASVVIKGGAFGTFATNDTATFAIVAQQLGKLSVGGTTIPRQPGASNDPIGLATVLGATRGATTDGFDFHAYEI